MVTSTSASLASALSPSLDLDDAFAEGDDSRAPSPFTTARLRNDIAQLPGAELWTSEPKDDIGFDEDLMARIGFAEDLQVPAHSASDDDQPGSLSAPSTSTSSFSPVPTPDDVEPAFASIALDDEVAGSDAQPDLHTGPPISNIHAENPEQLSPPLETPEHHVPPSEASEPPSSIGSESPPSPLSPHSEPPSTPHHTPKEKAAPPPAIVIGADGAVVLPAAVAAVSAAAAAKSNPSLPSPRSPTSSRHRPARSVGPSTFEKVMSKTRPTFLPPKNKEEDQKHLADWEQMMRLSRMAGQLAHNQRYLCVVFYADDLISDSLACTPARHLQRRRGEKRLKGGGWHVKRRSKKVYMYGKKRWYQTGKRCRLIQH
jgi:TBC1 domain family member 14